MARRDFIRDGSGNTVIPITNGEFFSEQLSVGLDRTDVYVSFYSDAAGTTPVAISAGAIAVSGEYDDGFFLTAGQNQSIDASTITTEAAYTPPVLDGCVQRVRLTLSGFTEANYMRAFAFKRG